MGRVSYSAEYADPNAGGGAEKFMRLKLDKGQTGLIVCPEPPWSEWVHELRLPVVENGVQLFEERERRDKTKYKVAAQAFLDNDICLGNPSIMSEKGIDVDNCPGCKGSQENKNVPVAKRRYSMNVVQYGMMPGGQLAQPFNARFVIWAFTARMFDELVRIANDHQGQLQAHDLRVGPPEEPVHFQRFPVHAQPGNAWRTAPGAQQYLAALTNAPGAKATDDQLRDACGRSKPLAIFQQDVDRVIREWTAAETGGLVNPMAGQAAFAGQAGLQAGFGDIMSTFPGQQPQQGAPFGQQPQQGYPAQPDQSNPFGQQPLAAQASPFGGNGQQPGYPQNGGNGQQPNPFAAGPAQHPLEAQAAMASAQQQGSPFAQQPQAQPQPGQWAGAPQQPVQESPFGQAPAYPQAQPQQQFAQQPQYAPPQQFAQPGPTQYPAQPQPGMDQSQQPPAQPGFQAPPPQQPAGQQPDQSFASYFQVPGSAA